MKIRNGFVSNSSSTSFCIGGITIDKDLEMEESNKLEEKGLEVIINADDGITYVGISIDKMEDNETKREFLERVKKMFIDFDEFKNKEVSIIYDGWYDG